MSSSGVRRFEDLECWKTARQLAGEVYALVVLPVFSRDFGLRDQIQKAAISVMANIAEGFGSVSNVEFIRFLGFASRSAIEVQSHLYLAKDLQYISNEQFCRAYEKAQECVNRIRAFIKYLKNARKSVE